MYRLDRNSFKKQNLEDAADYVNFWLSRTVADRLQAASYLNSVAYNYPLDNPPALDKTSFRIRHRSNE
jgi:hypothetical protein